MPASAPSNDHETVARTGDFEVTTAVRGAFLLVTLRGRYTDDLLGILQRQVFLQLRNLAVDAGALSGITMALARTLYYTAQALKSQSHALALVNPPDALRNFLKLLGADRRLPVLLADTQLPAQPQDLEAAAARVDRELGQVKKELETNALWQFLDREFCWACPFCGAMRDDVRIPSRVQVGMIAVERVWRHLHLECKEFVPGQPRYKSRAELEARVREANQMKLAASAQRAENLQSQVERLEEKAQWATNLQKGVKIAASRQRKLLPTRAPSIPGCEIAYSYRPAEEVSGDFYDFVEMPGGRLAFVIGDVSGHGIEAGILMGMTKKVLSIRLGECDDAAMAMRKANADVVKDMDRSSFVTVAVLVYDPQARTLTSLRAGHNPPLLYNPARSPRVVKFEAGGLMLGMAQPGVFDRQLQPEIVPVQDGDLLLLYTDGIEEGKNAQGEEFGLARIIPVLEAEHGKPGAYMLGALFYEFDRFAAGARQEDDLTAVSVKFSC
jgi:serine phosphatase RsbU (regulator of sigma subunit)